MQQTTRTGAAAVEACIASGCRELARREPVFAGLLASHGLPPLWQRPASLRTLIAIILEQKISLESARAVMQRVDALCPAFTPAALLAVPVDRLVAAGVSHRKATYCHAVAEAMEQGALDLGELAGLPVEQATAQLIRVRGIGPWTAGVYVMMVLCDPDAWASGDRALAVSAQECFGLEAVPTYAALDSLAEAWRPWRGAAARLLWHAYLLRRNRSGLATADA